MKHSLSALALLGIVVMTSPLHAAPEPTRIAPLRLPTLRGDTLDLRRLRGKKVLLIEFASW